MRRLDTAVARIDQQIAAAVKDAQSGLTDLFGIGRILAAKILGRIGDARRFPTAARFASYCGVAPMIRVFVRRALRQALTAAPAG